MTLRDIFCNVERGLECQPQGGSVFDQIGKIVGGMNSLIECLRDGLLHWR